jgi:hypothetical protein
MEATNDLIPDFDDFERYHCGEMSSVDQRSLEGRMLAEPLVAEAYEGFLAWRAQNTRIASVRTDLQERLHKRVALVHRKALPLWAYASAASILLALFSYWAVFLRDQKVDSQKPAVAVRQKGTTSSKSDQAPVILPSRRDKPLESIASARVEPNTSIPVKPGEASQPKQAVQALPKAELALAHSVLADAEAQEEVADMALADSFPTEKHISQAPSQPANALAAPGVVKAVGKSLAGRAGARQNDVDTQYLVASKPVSARKEITSVAVSSDTLRAVPVEGWPSYRAYLDKNTGSASTTGQIMVTFIISSSGTLSGFIAKGPQELQKDAIRIISNGPAWAPARSNGMPVISIAEIQMQFRQSQ